MGGGGVVVLNADFQYVNTVTPQRAIVLVKNGKAIVLKATDRVISTVTSRYLIPSVIKLVKMIRMLYRNKINFTKKNVMIRDKYTCQYCGSTVGVKTIDHIIPKAKGGEDSFENCVAACCDCNRKKGCKTPRQAGMVLLNIPKSPTIMEFLILSRGIDMEELFKELC